MTQMKSEIRQIPDVIDNLLVHGTADIQSAAAQLREHDPSFIITIGRGTSDHAAHLFKYAAELMLKRPVASVGPSISSIYDVDLIAENSVALAISQSGASPDIVDITRSLAAQIPTLSITNAPDSPLAQASTLNLDMRAGPELAVAATKTFVASCVTTLMLLAEWAENDELRAALRNLPHDTNKAMPLRWENLLGALQPRNSLYMSGRGASYALAHEAALKCKETCRIHAEAYSSAELLHGPSEIINDDFPVVFFTASDKAQKSVSETAEELSKRSKNIFITGGEQVGEAQSLPIVRTQHFLTDIITTAVSYYNFIEELSRLRGLNPDSPATLSKVTLTK